MKDVAAACGVTKSTVSRALRHPEKVSPRTRLHVEKAMAELGYVFNPVASCLSRPRRELLGIMFPLRLYSLYADILAVIDTMAAASDYEVMFSMTNGLPRREKEAFLRMRQYRASSFICLEASAEVEEMLCAAQREGCPCLMLHQTPKNAELNFVGVDLPQTTFTAVSELADLGHSRIGLLLGSRPELRVAEMRHAGYRDGLAARGLAYDPLLVDFLGALTPTRWHPVIAAVKVATGRMLHMANPPTAMVTPNSQFAAGVLAATREAGLRVPRDFSVITLHDDELASALDPQLCALNTSKVQEHILLSMFLQRLFHGEPVGAWRHILPIGVHWRGSCGPRRRS
jgi:LacI family transcriptional regulator